MTKERTSCQNLRLPKINKKNEEQSKQPKAGLGQNNQRYRLSGDVVLLNTDERGRWLNPGVRDANQSERRARRDQTRTQPNIYMGGGML